MSSAEVAFVEHQDAWVAQDGAGAGDALALPHRQAAAALGEHLHLDGAAPVEFGYLGATAGDRHQRLVGDQQCPPCKPVVGRPLVGAPEPIPLLYFTAERTHHAGARERVVRGRRNGPLGAIAAADPRTEGRLHPVHDPHVQRQRDHRQSGQPQVQHRHHGQAAGDHHRLHEAVFW